MKIKNLKLKIIFFGSSKFVIPILEVLQKNFDLSLVLTTEHLASQGETLQPRQPPVISYCIANKIPCLPLQQFNNETIEQLKQSNAPIAVLADFGLIIPKDILDAFPKGIINIHPSLLPKYRGPTPVQTAILNGDKITGITIIKLDEEVDHGPILSQKKVDILPNDTSESLYARLFELGSSSIVQTIELYLKEEIKPQEQDHSKATFTKSLTRQDGYLEISNFKFQISNFKLERMIRAYYPWPGVFTKLKINNKELRIKFLPYQKIQVEGRKPMSYKDFINGYPEAKNTIVLIIQKMNHE